MSPGHAGVTCSQGGVALPLSLVLSGGIQSNLVVFYTYVNLLQFKAAKTQANGNDPVVAAAPAAGSCTAATSHQRCAAFEGF